jgi:hypothetical protein
MHSIDDSTGIVQTSDLTPVFHLFFTLLDKNEVIHFISLARGATEYKVH